MIVRLLPLGKILLAAQENKLLLQLESKLTSWPPSVRRPAGVRPVGSGRSCRPPIGPAPPRTTACMRPTVARRASSDTQPRTPQETASAINGHSAGSKTGQVTMHLHQAVAAHYNSRIVAATHDVRLRPQINTVLHRQWSWSVPHLFSEPLDRRPLQLEATVMIVRRQRQQPYYSKWKCGCGNTPQ